jgi:uncharacterized Ntn-hydrolase superfamily protein
MTFSITGRCERSGMLGIAIATSSLAVGSRCPYVAAGVGAIASQSRSNPRLGLLGLELLRLGYTAPKVLKELEASDAFIEFRQVSVLDADGRAAARTGAENLPYAGHVAEANVVAMGNAIAGGGVIDAMLAAWNRSAEALLEVRLLRALEAGRDAGGEPKGQHSAALLVYDRLPYARVDLRIDAAEEAVGALRRLFDRYAPMTDFFQRRPVDPRIPSAEPEWTPLG